MPTMRFYEAILKYHVAENNLPSAIVDTPAKAAAYLRSTMETHPVQEGFCVILLTRRNRALGRHQVSLGTLTFQYPTGGREAVKGPLRILHGETVPMQVTLNSRFFTRNIVAQGGEWLP
jgi:DNA repair protein RadC